MEIYHSDLSQQREFSLPGVDPEVIVALGTFLLLQQHESAGKWGRIAFVEIAPEGEIINEF